MLKRQFLWKFPATLAKNQVLIINRKVILTFVEMLQFYVYLNQIWENIDCGQEQPRNAKNVIFDKVFKIF